MVSVSAAAAAAAAAAATATATATITTTTYNHYYLLLLLLLPTTYYLLHHYSTLYLLLSFAHVRGQEHMHGVCFPLHPCHLRLQLPPSHQHFALHLLPACTGWRWGSERSICRRHEYFHELVVRGV